MDFTLQTSKWTAAGGGLSALAQGRQAIWGRALGVKGDPPSLKLPPSVRALARQDGGQGRGWKCESKNGGKNIGN